MNYIQTQAVLGRLMFLAALACGVVGLIIGIVDRVWKLGVTGWFTGGTLLAVLAIAMLADAYFRTRSESTG